MSVEKYQAPQKLKKTTSALNKHVGLLFSYIHNRGNIPFSDIEPGSPVSSALEELKNLGLLRVSKHLDSLVMIPPIFKVIQHFSIDNNLEISNEDIKKSLNDIENNIALYALNRNNNKYIIKEPDPTPIFYLIEDLAQKLCDVGRQFSKQIYEKMETMPTIESKILFSRQQLNELNKINNVLTTMFTQEHLSNMGLFYDEFKDITQTVLNEGITTCTQEVISASSKLNEKILKYEKDLEIRKRNILISTWRSAYREGFVMPDESKVQTQIPDSLYLVKNTTSMVVCAQNFEEGVIIQAIKNNINNPTRNSVNKPKPSPVSVNIEPIQIKQQKNLIYEATEDFFGFVDFKGEANALEVYNKFQLGELLGIKEHVWVRNIIAKAYKRNQSKKRYQIKFDSTPIKKGYDTLLVNNVFISASAATQEVAS